MGTGASRNGSKDRTHSENNSQQQSHVKAKQQSTTPKKHKTDKTSVSAFEDLRNTLRNMKDNPEAILRWLHELQVESIRFNQICNKSDFTNLYEIDAVS